MSGYLLDTGLLHPLYLEKHVDHAKIVKAIDKLSSPPVLYVSVIARGEVEYGHMSVNGGNTVAHVELRSWLDSEKFPEPLVVTRHTASIYARIKAALFLKFPKTGGWKKGKKKLVEELTDPTSGRELGIGENDLWIASQAIEKNLVLVSGDKMVRISDAISLVPNDETGDYSKFSIENWKK